MDKDEKDDSITLHEAVRCGDTVLLERLLFDRGMDPNTPDWDGSEDPPILQATEAHVIRLLCKAGCDVDVRNVRGETALHLAACVRNNFSEDISSMKILLESGCNPNIQDNMNGRTAMHNFIRQLANSEDLAEDQKDVFQALAAKTNLNIMDHKQQTPLQILVNSGVDNLEYLKILLQNDADPSLQNGRGETALHEALESGWSDGALALISAGTDLTKRTIYHETPLHVAARRNRTDVVAALLTASAPVNAIDLRGNTALHLAAAKGYSTIVAAVLTSDDMDVNASNKDGMTPLHVAIESGFMKVVKMLLEIDRCDLMARTATGQNAFDLSQQDYRRRSQPEMALVLSQELDRRKKLNRGGTCFTVSSYNLIPATGQ